MVSWHTCISARSGRSGADSRDPALVLLREMFSTISLVWADSGYAGRLVTWARKVLGLELDPPAA